MFGYWIDTAEMRSTYDAGWLQRDQASAIDYLIEENKVLLEQLGDKQIKVHGTSDASPPDTICAGIANL